MKYIKYIAVLPAALLATLIMSAGFQAYQPLSDGASDFAIGKVPLLYKPAPVPHEDPFNVVSAMADIEGVWENVKAYTDLSEYIGLDESDNFIFKKPGDNTSRFVFLGDATDRGPHNIKILKALAAFKDNYPDRVFLILGNRDINKMRFNWELSLPGLELVMGPDGKALANVGFRFKEWAQAFYDRVVRNDNAVGYAGYDESVGYRNGHGNDESLVQDRFKKLLWLTENTLGAKDFIKNITDELRDEYGITEQKDVMDYILNYAKKPDDSAPDRIGGRIYDRRIVLGHEYYNYQKHAQIIYYDEPTKSIYCHGGIFHEEALGHIPGQDEMKIADVGSLKMWTTGLNAWAQNLIELGATATGYDQNVVDQVMALIQYQEPSTTVNANGGFGIDDKKLGYNYKSVVHGRPFINDTLSMMYVPSKQLKAAGVDVMVVGHTPIGDVPVVMKQDDLIVVAADSSFASAPKNSVKPVVVVPSGIRYTMKVFIDGAQYIVNYDSRHDPQLGTLDQTLTTFSAEDKDKTGNIVEQAILPDVNWWKQGLISQGALKKAARMEVGHTKWKAASGLKFLNKIIMQ